MPPTISVVILTHNRAKLLARCLQALARQSRPADEVLVVDNGSTDATREVLAEFSDGPRAGETAPSLPIRSINGPGKGGWAAARNLAVREARADWVAFTDDDCAPAEDWLERVDRHAQAGLDAVGGLVEPAGPLPYPWWWHPEMGWAVGLSVPGHRGPLAGSLYYPQTANWASRRAVLLQEPFQEIESPTLRRANRDLAETKRLYRSGREDAELWRRLRRKGFRTRFDAAMRVCHGVNPARLRFGTLARRAFQDGVALQRRESSRLYLEPAVDAILSLPKEMIFGVWRGRERVWREAAWRIIWAIRQGGQWAEAFRREGRLRAGCLLAWLTLKVGVKKALGAAKRAARTIGIACIRLRRRTPPRIARPRSIVVAAVGYLGDLVEIHPFLTGLKDRRPEVEITLITNPRGEEIYRHDPAVDHIVVVGGEKDARGGDPAAIRYALASRRAELILVPYFYDVSPRALYSRPGARVVTFAEQVGFSRRWWYDRAHRRAPKPPGRSEAGNLYRLFHEAGFQGPLPETPLAFLPDEVFDVCDALRAEGLGKDNLVIIAPGSGKDFKRWPEERWADVLRYLARDYDLRVALAGAPDERAAFERIARLAQCEPLIWCEASVRLLALRIAQARLLVCPDNGCKHLAVAMDTPSLTLFGPTDERQWGANREPRKHGVVRGCAYDLTEEERLGLPPTHQMDCITTAQVRRALDEMLSEH
jgi:ADP-heptose:LPS heptosyltransferase/GT2 family glycosyltransferase